MKFLTPLEFGKTFRRSRRTVYRWLNEGRVINPSSIVKVRDGFLIPESEVSRIIKTGKLKTR